MIIFDEDKKHEIEIIIKDIKDNDVGYDVYVDGKSLVDDPEHIFSLQDSPALIVLFKMMEVLYAL